MALDDDADEVGGTGPPPPPDDRLWRHPSELRQHGVGGGPIAPPPATMLRRPRIWLVAIVAGLGGAALSTAVIAATGMLPARVIEHEVEKVVVTTVVSSPKVQAWLGVEIADLTAERAMAMGVDGGALVLRVAMGSPASVAGLLEDDVITEVGGRRVSSISGLVVQLRTHEPGDEVAVGYWRHGRHGEATVILAERP